MSWRHTGSHKRPQCGRFPGFLTVSLKQDNFKNCVVIAGTSDISGFFRVSQDHNGGDFTTEEEKQRFALWISNSLMDTVKENYRKDGCKSRSAYIEKAIRFYTGYLHAQKASDFLPEVLSEILIGAFGTFGDRIGKQLFKLAVENNIGNHILAADTDMDVPTYEKLRGRSVREVQQTNGKISFKDDLIFQKSL